MSFESPLSRSLRAVGQYLGQAIQQRSLLLEQQRLRQEEIDRQERIRQENIARAAGIREEDIARQERIRDQEQFTNLQTSYINNLATAIAQQGLTDAERQTLQAELRAVVNAPDMPTLESIVGGAPAGRAVTPGTPTQPAIPEPGRPSRPGAVSLGRPEITVETAAQQPTIGYAAETTARAAGRAASAETRAAAETADLEDLQTSFNRSVEFFDTLSNEEFNSLDNNTQNQIAFYLSLPSSQLTPEASQQAAALRIRVQRNLGKPVETEPYERFVPIFEPVREFLNNELENPDITRIQQQRPELYDRLVRYRAIQNDQLTSELVAQGIKLRTDIEAFLGRSITPQPYEELIPLFTPVRDYFNNLSDSAINNLTPALRQQVIEYQQIKDSDLTPEILSQGLELRSNIQTSLGAELAPNPYANLANLAGAVIGLSPDGGVNQQELASNIAQLNASDPSRNWFVELYKVAEIDPATATPEQLQSAQNLISEVSLILGGPDPTSTFAGLADSLITNASSALESVSNDSDRRALEAAISTASNFKLKEGVSLEDLLGAQSDVARILNKNNQADAARATAATSADAWLEDLIPGMSQRERIRRLNAFQNTGLWPLLPVEKQQEMILATELFDPNAVTIAERDARLNAYSDAQTAFDTGVYSVVRDNPEAQRVLSEFLGVDPSDSEAFKIAWQQRQADLASERDRERQAATRDFVSANITAAENGITFLANNYSGDVINSFLTDDVSGFQREIVNLIGEDGIRRAAYLADRRERQETLDDPDAERAYALIDDVTSRVPRTADELPALSADLDRVLQAAGHPPGSAVYDTIYEGALRVWNAALDGRSTEAANAALEIALINRGIVPGMDTQEYLRINDLINDEMNALRNVLFNRGCIMSEGSNVSAIVMRADVSGRDECTEVYDDYESLATQLSNSNDLLTNHQDINMFFGTRSDGTRPVNIDDLDSNEVSFLVDASLQSAGETNQDTIGYLNTIADNLRSGVLVIQDGELYRVNPETGEAAPASIAEQNRTSRLARGQVLFEARSNPATRASFLGGGGSQQQAATEAAGETVPGLGGTPASEASVAEQRMALSRRFESGGDPTAISDREDEKAYGTYQFSTVSNFDSDSPQYGTDSGFYALLQSMASETPTLFSQLADAADVERTIPAVYEAAAEATDAFKAAWQDVAGTRAYQQFENRYQQEQYWNPVRAYFRASNVGLNADNLNMALQEILFDTSNQHGGNWELVFDRALETLGWEKSNLSELIGPNARGRGKNERDLAIAIIEERMRTDENDVPIYFRRAVENGDYTAQQLMNKFNQMLSYVETRMQFSPDTPAGESIF